MPACPKCQTEVAEGTAYCPSCGAAMAVGATSTGSSAPQLKFDLASLSQTERIVGIASLVLFISYFLPWYSVDGLTFSGLTGHGYLYIPLIVSLILVVLLALKALSLWQLPTTTPLTENQILLVGTAISLVLTVLAFIFKPGGAPTGIRINVGWSIGAFIGLAASIVAFLPLGRPFIEARRKR